MHFSFEKKPLRNICEKKQFGIDKLGKDVAKKLRARLFDLIAACTVNDLQAGEPSIVGDFPFDHFKINLDDNYRIIFCASHPKKYYLKNGNLDWSRVNRIKLLKIEKLE